MSDERWPICVKGYDVHRRRRRRESRTPGGRRDRHTVTEVGAHRRASRLEVPPHDVTLTDRAVKTMSK